MKTLLLAVAAMFALTVAFAQTAETGGSQEKTAPKSTEGAKTKKAKGHAITGCLSGPNQEGNYVLKHPGSKKEVEVSGSDELGKHVGHEVRLHGSWVKGEMGEAHEAEKGEAHEGKKGEAGERHFKVTSIDHISDTCPAAGAKHEHHHEDMEHGEGKPSPSPTPQL